MLRLCPMLVVEVNRVVSVDRLVDQLWGDDPPRRAVGSQHAYVSNLRRILEYDRPPRALLEAAASAAQAMGAGLFASRALADLLALEHHASGALTNGA